MLPRVSDGVEDTDDDFDATSLLGDEVRDRDGGSWLTLLLSDADVEEDVVADGVAVTSGEYVLVLDREKVPDLGAETELESVGEGT